MPTIQAWAIFLVHYLPLINLNIFRYVYSKDIGLIMTDIDYGFGEGTNDWNFKDNSF